MLPLVVLRRLPEARPGRLLGRPSCWWEQLRRAWARWWAGSRTLGSGGRWRYDAALAGARAGDRSRGGVLDGRRGGSRAASGRLASEGRRRAAERGARGLLWLLAARQGRRTTGVEGEQVGWEAGGRDGETRRAGRGEARRATWRRARWSAVGRRDDTRAVLGRRPRQARRPAVWLCACHRHTRLVARARDLCLTSERAVRLQTAQRIGSQGLGDVEDGRRRGGSQVAGETTAREGSGGQVQRARGRSRAGEEQTWGEGECGWAGSRGDGRRCAGARPPPWKDGKEVGWDDPPHVRFVPQR